MYEHNSKKLIENYANNHIPSGNSCWPVIDLSHLKPTKLDSRNLEGRCTDLSNLNLSSLRDLTSLDRKYDL